MNAWHRRSGGSESGVALVLVLGALAILTILLLALLQGTIHQFRGAESVETMAREKMMADTAAALVIGQISRGSTQTGQAWISQPGLLRTYAASATRAPTTCYKLYSTTNLPAMTDTTGTLAFVATDVPPNWSSEPIEYTDINAVAQNASGSSFYPVVDPGALTNSANQQAGTQVTGVSSDSGAVTMPVAWLYEMQDGTIGPASTGTATNPIVGRLAFWTDDETCKVNINTAGDGAPWNVPHVNSTNDVAWGAMQPAQGESSVYPGHPATTSLATVFGTNAYTPQQFLALTPRYAWGGSQLGTQATAPGATLAPKTDRLYPSLDELCFSATITSAGLRQPNVITPAQLEMDRFVLTAHSVAPETTLLGEPRIAIWPVADSTSSTAPRLTAMDLAIESDATVGTGTSTRSYFFQRHNAQSATDDLDAAVVPSNAQLFGDLVTRGNLSLPGYGASLAAKYSGASWTQLMLEITDFIRTINAVDSSPAPFVSYAPGDSTGLGRGFVEPLTTTYSSSSGTITLRGLGRCPTLSSLTLVFYVCGFGFKGGTSIDYDATPDDVSGTSWKANFLPGSATWKTVSSELIRAFVVPCTFDPGCGYPEVSDPCTISISGMDGLTVSSGTSTGSFGFSATATSGTIGAPLVNLSPDRAWGGNEGPLVWRAVGDAVAKGGSATYPFAGTKAFAIPVIAGTSAANLDPKTGGSAWPPLSVLNFSGLNGVTVTINDLKGGTLQTFTVNLPAFNKTSPYSLHAPTPNGECDHYDGALPSTSHTDWATNSAYSAAPSYYMSLYHRLQATQRSRAVMIQAGDISRGVEAGTDLRVIAALPNVPASLFSPHPGYQSNALNTQSGSHAQNLRFADGTSVCFAPGATTADNKTPANASYGLNRLTASAAYPTSPTTLITATDWRNGATQVYYNYFAAPPCSVLTGSNYVTMTTGVYGDWDTGPGLEPDGAQINLPDEGTSLAAATAYFSLTGGQPGAATQRLPNALVPSPVIFGSLPTGINPSAPAQSEPWRTLLFCPFPAGDAAHPGFGNATATPPVVPDHLVLDNFWMPVVEPYAISTCMATAGKINLNDPIVPFTYLHRNTALRALFDSLRIPAISASAAATYKTAGTPSTAAFWYRIDPDATVAQVENKFANSGADAYLSESEICTVPLVPQGLSTGTVATTRTALDSFWNNNGSLGQLTGDNLRELPYAQLYSRLTTRSNSYTVHMRVQVLRKLPSDPDQGVWKEGTDVILGDWRGSYEIERYLSPDAKAPAAGSALGPYLFRVVSARRFAP